MLELFIYVSVTKSFYRKKMKTDEDSKIPQKIEKADFIPTQNSCGFMMSKLNEIQTMAVEHAIKNDGAFVDIGCAYGIAALEAIKGGMKGKVVGIDSCVEHLDIFKEEANKLENSKNVEVETICGYYPLKESILKGQASTVLASLIFHFLCPEDLRKGLKQVYEMLKPGGKCFIVNMTMYMKTYSHFLPIYKERCDENKKFQEWELNHKDSSDSKNPFNYYEFPGTIDEKTVKAGFDEEMKKSVTKVPETLLSDGREFIVCVAKKPTI